MASNWTKKIVSAVNALPMTLVAMVATTYVVATIQVALLVHQIPIVSGVMKEVVKQPSNQDLHVLMNALLLKALLIVVQKDIPH